MTETILRLAEAWRELRIRLDLFHRDRTDGNLRALVDAKNELTRATDAAMLEAYRAHAPNVLARAEGRLAKARRNA